MVGEGKHSVNQCGIRKSQGPIQGNPARASRGPRHCAERATVKYGVKDKVSQLVNDPGQSPAEFVEPLDPSASDLSTTIICLAMHVLERGHHESSRK